MRSNHPEVFLVKGVQKICSKFKEEHPRRTVTLIKLKSVNDAVLMFLWLTLNIFHTFF